MGITISPREEPFHWQMLYATLPSCMTPVYSAEYGSRFSEQFMSQGRAGLIDFPRSTSVVEGSVLTLFSVAWITRIAAKGRKID